MKTKKVFFSFKGKRFSFDARKCSVLSSGLMFRSSKTKPCLFEFERPRKFKITSLFVFFPFVAVWLDERNKIVDVKIVRPFTFEISPSRPFKKLLEVPVNKKNLKAVHSLVGRKI